MHGAAAETVAIIALIVSLAVAVIRPRGISEAIVAAPAAVLVVLLGIVPRSDAWRTLLDIGPTVGFLAAILLFGHLCAKAGVFTYLGAVAGRISNGDRHRLLVIVVVLAAGVTAVLTLDATVVLLTPVVLATVARSGIGAVRPYAYACVRLANSGSLLLPVSNLTNLLAFSACDLSFGRFAALMALPWLIACTAEWIGLRTFFRDELRGRAPSRTTQLPAVPRYGLGVLAATVTGFVAFSALHVAPAWAALAGCAALLIPRVRRRDVKLRSLVREASPGFCIFMLALSVVVEAVTRHGLGTALQHALPSTTSLGALVALALAAAVLANLVNNLPATLLLLPLIAGSPAAVLAVLIGVNVGPNASYAGSLATLLWRRLLPHGDRPRAREFHRYGLLTVPATIILSTVGLWLAVAVLGV